MSHQTPRTGSSNGENPSTQGHALSPFLPQPPQIRALQPLPHILRISLLPRLTSDHTVSPKTA